MTIEGLPETSAKVAAAVGWEAPRSYVWTREMCFHPLPLSSVQDLVSKTLGFTSSSDLKFPDEEDLVQRCVLALLTGHLVLQGPPGTGKTTLARALAGAFNSALLTTTATADWTTYDVVGGLRPTARGILEPALGVVPRAALSCASTVRTAVNNNDHQFQADWLLIDELNRADIDKAIGPLYTVLSSIAPEHLAETPLELWFEQDERDKVWIPGRFRIIATMNDVDTSFVNPLSQGLTRRFTFIEVGVSTASGAIEAEVDAALTQAVGWARGQYQVANEIDSDALFRQPEAPLQPIRTKLMQLLEKLRSPAGTIRWPIGTAQVVDVWRVVVLAAAQEDDLSYISQVFDSAVADRMVAQAGMLDDSQLSDFESWLSQPDRTMPKASRAVARLRATASVI